MTSGGAATPVEPPLHIIYSLSQCDDDLPNILICIRIVAPIRQISDETNIPYRSVYALFG